MKKYELPHPARIAGMKKEHGQLHKLSVLISENETAVCILRHPRLEDISMSFAIGDDDKDAQAKIIFQNCWLEGDERIMFVKDSEYVIPDAGIFRSIAKQALYLFASLKFTVQDEGENRSISVTTHDGEVLKGTFKNPDLLACEKASTASDFLAKGAVFANECVIDAPAVFFDESDHEISFAVYMAGHLLLKKYTASVEKL